MKELQEYWNPHVERGGFITKDGTIIQVENEHPDPANYMMFTLYDKVFFEGKTYYWEDLVATWHTHPNEDANLSFEDYALFRELPGWYHYIVAQNKVVCYFVENDAVLIYEDPV